MKSKMKVMPKRDQYTVVLESLHSDFKVFGEALSAVRDELRKETSEIKMEIVEVKIEIAEMKKEIMVVKEDLEIMKSELAIIRHNQVTRDEFKFLETRVHRLEKVISRR